MRKLLLPVLLLALTATTLAQKPPKKNAAAASDGTITLFVDASEAPRKILHARLTIPATAGTMTLYYPKWIPGEHGPVGPIGDLTGVHFTAGGKELEWRRDLVDMYAFHVTVPAGTTKIEASLDYLEPASGSFSSGSGASDQMAVISWNQLLLYPLPPGKTARDIMFQPNLHLPGGWQYGTALERSGGAGSGQRDIEFEPVSLEQLIDSPVIAGHYFRVVPLQGDTLRHQIDIAADSAEALDMSAELQQQYSNLVAETGMLFGARHYHHYDFLLTLSDHTAHFGLEHHQSSDNRVGERSLIEEGGRKLMSGLLPHEMVHSWNGKYRRPADLATPDYQKPMQTDLLWVYEGLTTYWGYVLTGRSGLLSLDDEKDSLAITAAQLDHRPGRTWRPLQDTADAAQVLYGRNATWASWRRSTDFYEESELIWLEADTVVRQLTGNKKSLDDFAHLFHGGKNTGPEVVPYTFDDLCNAMNKVAPYDWRKFFADRLDSKGEHAPMGGITNAGWRVVYKDQPSPMERVRERERHYIDLTYSIGLSVSGGGSGSGDAGGRIIDVLPGMPAAQAGVGPGMRILAVNGRKFSSDGLKEAVAATKGGGPLELLLENDDYIRPYRIQYNGGARYPYLERDEAHPDLLSDILKPHSPQVEVGK